MRALLLSLALLLSPAAASAPERLRVFGHKIPDTDAVCAAMAYAWELGERGVGADAYRLGKLNRETEYVLRALKLEEPPMLSSMELAPDEPVAIVDTNNPEELPEGVNRAAIHSVIDHHKLVGGLTTASPIEIDVRPLCSTGSILYARAKAAGRSVPPHIAGLMLSCILSDSLEFRSPTTTELDRQLAAELAEIAGLDMHAHAEAMLDAKAEIGHLSPEELVLFDSKSYKNIGGTSMRISVIETTRPERALRQKDALAAAQREVAKREGLDEVLLFVVDVLNEQATYVPSTREAAAIVERAWNVPNAFDGETVLPGVLSRKKQIVPVLEAAAQAAAMRAEAAGVEESVGVSPTAQTARVGAA